jgi:hypothetical protein
MNRPLALIEGALALPSSRPLSGLPPPFGSWRRSASYTQQRVPQPAMPGVPQYTPRLQLRRRNPPNNRFQFFYKLPQRPNADSRFDEQLAEARHYLQADSVRPHSSRSDRILGAAIFVSCSIALAWLLATCSMHDVADKFATAAKPSATSSRAGAVTVQPLADVQPDALKAMPRVAEAPQRIAQAASSVVARSPQIAPRIDTASSSQQRAESQRNASTPRHLTADNRLAKAYRTATAALTNRVEIEKQRRGSNHSIDSLASASVLRAQPERTTPRTFANDSTENAALFDWAAQQRRANANTRTTSPASSQADPDWNAHMTQRRITDNPAAFQADRAQP